MVVKKSRFRFLINAFLCTAVFFTSLQAVSALLRDKGGSTLPSYQQEPVHQEDVLFLGSSHIYFNVNPAVLWEEQGIAAWNAAASYQPVWTSLRYLQEVCAVHKPQVAVVDVFGAVLWKDDFEENQERMQNGYRQNVQFLRTPAVWASSIQDAVPREDRLSYYFDLISYHNRLPELSRRDFEAPQLLPGRRLVKGYLPYGRVVPFSGDVSPLPQEGQPGLSPKNEKAIRELASYCQSEGISLLLLNTSYVPDSYTSLCSVSDQAAALRGIRTLALELDIPFLDYTQPEEGFSPDWKLETGDGGQHLNTRGAHRFSQLLGQKLRTLYSLPDRREDSDFFSWEKAGSDYRKLAENETLALQTDASCWISSLPERCLVLLAWDSPPQAGSPAACLAESLGLTALEESGVAVVNKGDVLFQGQEYFSYHLEGHRVHLTPDRILLDGEEAAPKGEGMKAVVFDAELDMTVDGVILSNNEFIPVFR